VITNSDFCLGVWESVQVKTKSLHKFILLQGVPMNMQQRYINEAHCMKNSLFGAW
jgi:hypothetical protein